MRKRREMKRRNTEEEKQRHRENSCRRIRSTFFKDRVFHTCKVTLTEGGEIEDEERNEKKRDTEKGRHRENSCRRIGSTLSRTGSSTLAR